MVGDTTVLKKVVAGMKICVSVSLMLGFLATSATAQVFISKEREKQIGREQHPLAIAEFGGIYSEKGLDQYITDVGNRIAKFSNDPDLGYTFTLVNFSGGERLCHARRLCVCHARACGHRQFRSRDGRHHRPRNRPCD